MHLKLADSNICPNGVLLNKLHHNFQTSVHYNVKVII